MKNSPLKNGVEKYGITLYKKKEQRKTNEKNIKKQCCNAIYAWIKEKSCPTSHVTTLFLKETQGRLIRKKVKEKKEK